MSAPLVCPGCRAAMIEIEEGQVAVDVCGDCGGLWLDRGELEQKGARLPADLVAISPDAPRECPRCAEPMGLFRGQLLEVDLCEGCGGVYLDAGEIELLMKARRIERPPRSRPDAPDLADEPTAVRHPKPAAAGAKEVQFRCDYCGEQFPVRNQVVGVKATACTICAGAFNVTHDPRGRRQVELERRDQGEREEADAGPSFVGTAGEVVAEEVAEVVFEGVLDALFSLF